MEEKDRKLIRMLGVLSTVGIALAASIFIGLFIGLQLDKWLGTFPWLTAAFLIFGIIAGFRNLFFYAKRSQGIEENNKGKK